MTRVLGKYRLDPNLHMATSLGEGNSKFKPALLHLKIDLESHPIHG